MPPAPARRSSLEVLQPALQDTGSSWGHAGDREGLLLRLVAGCFPGVGRG